MPYKNKYYRVLGIKEPCTDNEIKSAYRRKIKQIHPDNSSLNGEIETDHGRIRQLIEARDWLLKCRYTDSCDYIQFQTDSVINNYFAKGVQRAREKYAKEQKKKKRRNLQNKIDDILIRIKKWNMRGIAGFHPLLFRSFPLYATCERAFSTSASVNSSKSSSSILSMLMIRSAW